MKKTRTRLPKITTKFETITPEKARRYYTSSRLNRAIDNANVLAYSLSMKRGEWRSIPPIYFDLDGRLVDGHNRMKAIMLAGVSVRLLVIRGLSQADVEALDVGRRRTVPQQLKMFRPEAANRNTLVSYVNMAAYLMTNNRVKLFTLHDLDEWYVPMKEGIDWALSFCLNDAVLSPGTVGGALAFAYKTAPEMVMKFAKNLAEPNGLDDKDPARKLRQAMSYMHPAQRSSTYRILVSRKVLNCLKAFIDGEKVTNVSDDDSGRRFFCKAHDKNKGLLSIATPWRPKSEQLKLVV